MNKRPAVSPLQHNEEIYRNLEAWNRKPLLQRVYFGFYCEMARYLSANAHGLTVELGSGIGNIKKVIPHCITTDIFPNPWLDRQENAYRLSLAEGSVSNLILFDVWHHLQFPGTALKEFGRVLSRKGRLILFEPGMGLLGRLIYSVAHHEPLASHEPIEWFAPTDFSPDEAPYFAAQSHAHRMFVEGEFGEMFRDWEIVDVRLLSSLAYLFSGGFSKPQLCPDCFFPLLNRLDRILSRIPSLFAVRLLAVLEKQR